MSDWDQSDDIHRLEREVERLSLEVQRLRGYERAFKRHGEMLGKIRKLADEAPRPTASGEWAWDWAEDVFGRMRSIREVFPQAEDVL